MGLSREVLEDLSTERFQENVARELTKQSKEKAISGCIGSLYTKVSDGIYQVDHQLGREVSGFVITSQTSTKSLYAEVVDAPSASQGVDKTKTFFLKFTDKELVENGTDPTADPTAFTVFVF